MTLPGLSASTAQGASSGCTGKVVPGQLDLFKGKRQRGTKAPPALERATHIALADAIRISISPGWLWFHVPNGELRETQTANLLKRMGVSPGVSDFIFIAPALGRVHALELKRRGRTPTETQRAFLSGVRAAGGIADWCDNFEDAIRILKGWGAVRDKLHVQGMRELVPYAGKDPNERTIR
jgi:hypothetical protein